MAIGDFIASVLGLVLGIGVVAIFYSRLFKLSVSFSIKMKYNNLKSKNPNMSDQELLINTLKSRFLFRKLSTEAIMDILRKESIKSLEELIAYISKEEYAYQKDFFLKGAIRAGRDKKMNSIIK